MKQVTKNCYVETEMTACNLGFVATKAGVVMIDTPMKPTDAVKWRDQAGGKGEIRYLINTEEHPDHWQTSHFFPGILITSKATRDKLAQFPVAKALETIRNMDPASGPLMEGYKIRLADIAITGATDIHVGDHTIQLFPLAGHSDGGIGVYIPEERVVFTTDIVFQKKKSWLHESQPEQWIASLKKLGALDVEVVVPGHGELCTKEYLKEQSGIIEQWIEAVKSAIKKGWSAEEAGERVSCPDPYPKQAGTPMTEPELNRAIVTRLYQLYS